MTRHAHDRYATATEAAEYLRISRRGFGRLVAPHLTPVPIGKRKIYDWDEVEEWAEKQRVDGTSDATEDQTSGTSDSGTRGRTGSSPRAREIAERLLSKRSGSTSGSRRSKTTSGEGTRR